MRARVVLTTVSEKAQAHELAQAIVAEKLAACVQIVPGLHSVYAWEGEVQSDREVLLIIKTVREKIKPLERYILENHPYSTPEFVVLESSYVSKKYREWLGGYLEG